MIKCIWQKWMEGFFTTPSHPHPPFWNNKEQTYFTSLATATMTTTTGKKTFRGLKIHLLPHVRCSPFKNVLMISHSHNLLHPYPPTLKWSHSYSPAATPYISIHVFIWKWSCHSQSMWYMVCQLRDGGPYSLHKSLTEKRLLSVNHWRQIASMLKYYSLLSVKSGPQPNCIVRLCVKGSCWCINGMVKLMGLMLYVTRFLFLNGWPAGQSKKLQSLLRDCLWGYYYKHEWIPIVLNMHLLMWNMHVIVNKYFFFL